MIDGCASDSAWVRVMNNVNVMGRVIEKVDAVPPELSPFKASATAAYTPSSPRLSLPCPFNRSLIPGGMYRVAETERHPGNQGNVLKTRDKVL